MTIAAATAEREARPASRRLVVEVDTVRAPIEDWVDLTSRSLTGGALRSYGTRSHNERDPTAPSRQVRPTT
jgi:hypothetical protein